MNKFLYYVFYENLIIFLFIIIIIPKDHIML